MVYRDFVEVTENFNSATVLLCGVVLRRPKNFSRNFLSFQKKMQFMLYYRDYDWHFLGGKFPNLKLYCHFLLHSTFTSGYLCTIALILFIHVGFLEYIFEL
jgi:hypothetical protein